MTEIEELLAKLKKLDPDAWDAWMSLYCAWEGVEYALGAELGQSDLYLLQGVIQDAIAARGWGFYVSTECDNWWDAESISDMEITFAASILLPDDEMYDFWDGLQLEWCRADAPAEAILAAYIAALEAGR